MPQGFPCAACAVDRGAVFFGEGSRAADMIGMFVGEKQGGNILRFAPDMFQPLFEDARSEADINQDACLLAFDIDGVALTAAGEYGKLKNGFLLSRSTSAGTWLTVDSRRWSLSAI